MKRMNLRTGRRSLRLLLVATAGLAMAAGVAYATIPNAAGVINGCYRTSLDDQKGQLRVVDDASSCRNNETAIQWNQTGPQGLQGPRGEPGAAGTDGKDGTNGTNGIVGAQGDPCLPTNPACVGPTGPTGAAGANGTNATNGVDGTNGINGVDGAPGATGAPCLPTNPACVGPKGNPGEKGETGAKGDKGDPGANGTNGAVHWARVAANGDLLDHSSAVLDAGILNFFGEAPGHYMMEFDRDVKGCAWTATLSDSEVLTTSSGAIAITVTTMSTQLLVHTWDSSGTYVNHQFSITVIC